MDTTWDTQERDGNDWQSSAAKIIWITLRNNSYRAQHIERLSMSDLVTKPARLLVAKRCDYMAAR
jgi:hypothetical protein